MRAQVKYGIIQRYASKYPVISMCRFFDISRNGYYSFRKRSKQLNRESLLEEQIQEHRNSADRPNQKWITEQHDVPAENIIAMYQGAKEYYGQ